jgi:hypothetical protein
MARRPQNKSSLLIAGAGIAVIIALVSFLGFSKKAFSKGEFNKCAAFPVDSYLDGDTVWSNADYVIEGTFQNILLKQQSSDSTLCSVVTDDKKIPLPVIFTLTATKNPLMREQRIKVKVRVEDDGRIIASDCMIQ